MFIAYVNISKQTVIDYQTIFDKDVRHFFSMKGCVKFSDITIFTRKLEDVDSGHFRFKLLTFFVAA